MHFYQVVFDYDRFAGFLNVTLRCLSVFKLAVEKNSNVDSVKSLGWS